VETKHLLCATSSSFLAEALRTCLQRCPEILHPVSTLILGTKPPDTHIIADRYDILVLILQEKDDVFLSRPVLDRLFVHNPDLLTVAMIKDLQGEPLLHLFPRTFTHVLTTSEDFTSVALHISNLCGREANQTPKGNCGVREFATFSRIRHQHEFTPRENEILRLLARGMSTKEISYQMGIRATTVVSHRRNIYMKTGINSLQQLMVFAVLNHYDTT
jgi:DNA-binding CsgD family transcriptional regulator